MKVMIEIPFASEKEAKEAHSALQSETSFQKRATSALKLNGKTLTIEIKSEDLASLHATTASYMRALKVMSAVKSA